MKPTDAAIVGMGAVFPRAADLSAFWRNIATGVDAISDVPPDRWDPAVYYAPDGPAGADRFYCRRGGFVDDLATFDPIRFGVMPNAVDATEPDQLLALRTTAEAIADAGGEDRLPDRSRIGVIFGRGGYMGVATARLDTRVRTAHQLAATLRELVPELDEARIGAVREAFQNSLGPDRPEASIGLVPSFTAARIANRLDFGGPVYTVDAACATSLIAVEQAVTELATGRCDLVVAGSVHHCHIATLWSVFTQLRALSPSERIRPFDRRADGTLISEGTGVVLLKRLADAERDGDRIYAVIRGVGVASDGRASSLMSPLVDGQVRALERAWRAAGLDPTAPRALGLLEAHGTGTPVGDQAELATLARVFGPPGPGDPIGLGTVKSMIGHAMQASGIAGLIKAALAVHHGMLPPTLHVDEPHPGFAETRMRPLAEAEPWERNGRPRRAGVNAFGFGGINSHVILEEPPAPALVMHPLPTVHEKVMRLAAGSVEELARRLEDQDETADGPCRLAIVNPTPRRLELAAKVVARGRPWRGRGDVWFTSRPMLGAGGGRVAFLFPGLEPEFAPRVGDVAAHFKLPPPQLSGGSELVERAVDVIAVGRFLAAALDELGIRADLFAGHSLGEWTAMVVAGMYPRTAIDAFLDSLRPGALAVPDLTYAAVGCGAGQAEGALEGLGVVSHDNCPHQSVICGPRAGVAKALERLNGEGVLGQELPFRSGFHTPMWEPYLDQVRASFEHLPLQRPELQVWSATTGAAYPSADEDVRALVIRHMLEPVRFRTLTERLHESGVRAFVQVGPGSLTGFVDDTLNGHDHLAVAAGDPRHSGLGQLRRAAAALWVEGLSPRWERLDAAPERKSKEVRLALGSPLVRLGKAAAPLVLEPGGKRYADPESHPVLASLDAALEDMNAAVRTVVGAWDRDRAGRQTNRRIERVFSLETMPYVRDHCIYLQPEDWPEDSDRFPVVPMTTLLEIMGEAAAALRPGRVVAGFTDVRALRWLPVAPPATVDITATLVEPDQVKVTVAGYTSATVLLADDYPVAPPPGSDPLVDERTPPVSAPHLYADRWMFHGPGFAGVREVCAVAADGIRGELETLPAPGALLDAAGQLLGHWMQVSLTKDRLVFPVSIDRVSFYGPPPREGDRLPTTARIRAVKDTTVRGDVELRTRHGRVWARLEGWTYRRFAADERVWPMKFTPETHAIGEPQPGGWCLVRRRWSDTASRELVMRRYLGAAERADYDTRAPRQQDPWLLGRVAVKDAVRHLLWARGTGPIFPAEVEVGNDSSGAPQVRGASEPAVSLAHKDLFAVAIAGPDGVGIDIEQVADRGDSLDRVVFTEEERALLPAEHREEWLTRFWCAKEAVAKARRTGIHGRPRSFVVTSVEGTRICVECEGRAYAVETTLLTEPAGTYVVAWTTPHLEAAHVG